MIKLDDSKETTEMVNDKAKHTDVILTTSFAVKST